MDETLIRIAKELASVLDNLIEKSIYNIGEEPSFEAFIDREDECKLFLWENKVGILRILQEVAKL